MRPARLISLTIGVSIFVAACASSQSAGWTFAPQPATASPAGSAGASAGASGGAASASAAASPAASASVPASAGASAGAGAVAIAAQNIQFSTSSLSASAGTPFQIVFDNQDQGAQHNVAIRDSSQKVVFAGDIVTGPVKKTYDVPALPAGTYSFFCQVHPTMTGTLTVK